MPPSELDLFGARVRAERERLGIPQEELARRAGLHRTYVGGVERGERNLGLLNVIRIARALGVPVTDLLGPPDSQSRRSRERRSQASM